MKSKFTQYKFGLGITFCVVVLFAVIKEPECESTPTGEADDDDDDDEDESSRREGSGLEQVQAQLSLSHVHPSEFSMDPQSSPGEGESSLEGRPAAGG